MELRRYWGIIRKWYWLMALGLIVAAGAAYAVSASMTPIYAATVTLRVNEAQSVGLPGLNDLILSERLSKTYSELISSRPVIEEVNRQFGIDQSYKVAVSPVRDTQLIRVTVRHSQPQQAADIANKIAEVFIAQVGESQEGQLSSARQGLRKQLVEVESEIRTTATSIESLSVPGNGRTPDARAAEETRLRSMLSQYQLVYSQLIKSEQELAVAEARSGGGVRIAIPAIPNTTPVEPLVVPNTLLAAIIGLVLAAGVAFLIEYLDDTVKTAEDVEQAIDLPTFGIVGVAPPSPNGKAQSGELVASDPKSQFGEAYRMLRTNLQFATLNRPCKALMVCSAGPSEGKSFTLSNLGVVLAQAGARVILVDSDVRRPTLHKVFGVSGERGLTNLLLSNDQTDVEPYLQPTLYSGLRVLTSGRPLPPNPTELLSSPQMARAVDALKQASDVVLFDSPPALSVADAAILSALVDGVLLVVDAGRNRKEAIARARDVLSRPGASLLGAVLNRFTVGPDGYYYYYYYYNYRYRYAQPKGSKAES